MIVKGVSDRMSPERAGKENREEETLSVMKQSRKQRYGRAIVEIKKKRC
jgi:hypothetical protein